ncbi:MAG: hypothetical protein ACTHMM_18465 [Agriterribacter sp.]
MRWLKLPVQIIVSPPAPVKKIVQPAKIALTVNIAVKKEGVVEFVRSEWYVAGDK